MKKNIYFLIMSGLLTISVVQAQSLKTIRATKKLAENIVSLVQNGDIDSAFNQLKENWPLAPAEIADLKAHTQEQRKVVIERFGKPLGFEFIRTEEIGTNLVRYVFIEKFERHALRWYISFYKPEQTWVVNNLYWDDKISELYTRST